MPRGRSYSRPSYSRPSGKGSFFKKSTPKLTVIKPSSKTKVHSYGTPFLFLDHDDDDVVYVQGQPAPYAGQPTNPADSLLGIFVVLLLVFIVLAVFFIPRSGRR